MTRFVRRTLAPLVTGALAAGVLVAVTDASDALPFTGVLTQATEEDAPSDSTIPVDQLDLEDLVAQTTEFDTDSVFVDLGPAGDFPGIYDYGTETGVENVARELKLFLAGDGDPDGEGPIVAERDAAERFLLDEQCNGLAALPIRKQVTRPIRARILRDDEELIAQVNAFLGGGETPEGVPPISALPAGVEIDPIGVAHVPPMESVVEIGRVTVSVLDLDLIRARPPALLADLVAEDPALAALLSGDPNTGDAYGTPEFFRAAWASCLVEAAEERTVPVAQTLAGLPVFALKRDHTPDVPVTADTPDVDTVAWLEDGLEVRVEASFLNVDDDIRVNPETDLDTRTWLEHFANSVEPAMEVASRIVAGRSDEFELLEREAFSPITGFEYGETVAGTEDTTGTAIRREEEAMQNFLAEVTATASDPAGAATPDTEDAESVANRVLRASARLVYPTGAELQNTRRRFQEPPNPFLVGPVGAVQMVASDPEFLNSDGFRDGWKQGIADASEVAVDLDTLTSAGQFTPEVAAELRGQGVVDLVVSQAEGTFRTDYLLPCYSVTVSSITPDRDLDIAGRALAAQKAERDKIFGISSTAGLDEEDAGDGGDLFSPLLDDLERRDYGLASLKARDQRTAEQQAADAAVRAKEDARRAALCSSSNLQEHLTGEPVEDADHNGVADRLAENDAAKLEDAATLDENEEAGP